MNLDTLQDAIGYRFEDEALLREALTHKTWAEEHGGRDQQRLEFLGDAVLGYIVGADLFSTFEGQQEGGLTTGRKRLVKGDFIAAVGERWGVPELVRMGKGESANRANNKAYVEDTVEALIGAVHQDGGLEPAAMLIKRNFLVRVDESLLAADEDPTVRFNEEWQRRHRAPPPPIPCQGSGPANATTWTATLTLLDGTRFIGHGDRKQDARRDARAKALARWDET